MEHVREFQPLSYIHTLRRYMYEIKEVRTLDPTLVEGVRMGLAWAIVELMDGHNERIDTERMMKNIISLLRVVNTHGEERDEYKGYGKDEEFDEYDG